MTRSGVVRFRLQTTQHIRRWMTHRRDRNQNFNEEAGQGVLNVLVFDFQEILGTLLQKDIRERSLSRGKLP